MKVTATLLLAAALGASAHPSGHAHKHAHRSALEERGNFVMANKPVVEPTTTSVAPPPPTTTSVAPEPTTTSSSSAAETSSASSGGSGTAQPFCDGAKSKRATAEEIAYAGNVGTEGNYGCNLMMVDAGVADQYKHLTTFENVGSDDQVCACWLKIGPTGGINGFFKGNQAVNFDLPAGEKAYLAADENSQGGCACGSGSVPLTSFGEFASTWLEFDFDNESNGGWSGADASCLVAAASGLDIPGLKVCGHGTCSTINAGGTGDNAYLGGMEAEDGVGLNLAPGKTRLEVSVNYSG